MIAEYKRVDLAVDWPFDLVAASVLLGVVLRPKRVDWTDVFVVGGFGTLAFAAVREILAFAVVSAPVLGRTWGSVFHDALGALAKRQSGPRNALAARWGLFAMILSASLFVNVKSARDWLFPFGFGKNPIHYPERALDFLEAQSVRGPIFNTDIWASSILWRWHGTNLPVFVDARLEAYPEDFWRDKYYRVLRAAPGWKHVLEEYDVQCAILRRTPGETDDRIGDVLWDDPEWGLVYWDDYAMIYLKKGNQRPRNAQVLATWAFTSFNPRRVQRIEELRGQTLVQAANELAELAEWSPESFLPWWALAVAWTRLGEGTRAVEIFARLGERKEATLNAPAFYRSRGEAELVAGHRDLWVSWMKRAGRNPDDPEALFEAASLASRAKGFSVAEELYREVLAKDPGHADAMNNLAVLLAREESGIPEALSLLEKAIAAHPGDPYYLASRGEVRWRAGDMARAGEDLQRAFEMLPKDDEAAREEVSRLIKRMD
jgi:tetratricopeptide (TPR) repeat protein